MKAGKATFWIAAIAAVLSLSACAIWFVPESRSRGHIFDEASRGIAQLDEQEIRQWLDLLIHERFPPGTPLADVTGYIEGVGGACSSPDRTRTKPGRESTICIYESDNYFARAFMGMGEPSYILAENKWTVFVVHSGGAVLRYVVQSEADLNHLSRDDYLEGLDRQRAEEELARATDQKPNC